MGQLGSELAGVLREQYGNESVIATDIKFPQKDHVLANGETLRRSQIHYSLY